MINIICLISTQEQKKKKTHIKTELNALMCVSSFGFCEHYFNLSERENELKACTWN